MQKNTVSIILPTYNRASYLNRSVDSIINQTHTNWELLIIDDGSTDETLSLVKVYLNRFPNVRYFFHENRGAAYSMNVGMQNAKGDFITFLGSDDEYLEHHLAERVDFLNNNLKVDLLHSPAKIIGNGIGLIAPLMIPILLSLLIIQFNSISLSDGDWITILLTIIS